ncbi:uncharacterized protein TrAFT101_002522 [Trichoderma asperellum]|uniref:uncharacterized protein n=1 Tax=Trichoderma asperellum TaxID=101201 RepID=UPI00332F8EBD|nr:hypothetical protein TrAFT101_002522 [Trichoderma asperellum]
MRKGIYANRPVRMRQKEVHCIEGRNIELRRIQAKDCFVRRKATLLRSTAVQKSCRTRQKDSDVNLSRQASRAIPPILNPDPDKESALRFRASLELLRRNMHSRKRSSQADFIAKMKLGRETFFHNCRTWQRPVFLFQYCVFFCCRLLLFGKTPPMF